MVGLEFFSGILRGRGCGVRIGVIFCIFFLGRGIIGVKVGGYFFFLGVFFRKEGGGREIEIFDWLF